VSSVVAVFVVVADNFRVSPVAWFFLAVRFSLDCCWIALFFGGSFGSSRKSLLELPVLLPGEQPRKDRAIGVLLPGHGRFVGGFSDFGLILEAYLYVYGLAVEGWIAKEKYGGVFFVVAGRIFSGARDSNGWVHGPPVSFWTFLCFSDAPSCVCRGAPMNDSQISRRLWFNGNPILTVFLFLCGFGTLGFVRWNPPGSPKVDSRGGGIGCWGLLVGKGCCCSGC
jgi:hypothetical protein